MDDLFAPPQESWNAVSPRLAWLRRSLLGLLVAVLVVLDLVAAALFSWPILLIVVPLVVVVMLGGFGWWVIGRNARWWGYAERDEDLYIRRGAMFRRLVVVPYGRMQYVDVHAGPVDQVFGVANVHLHTASPGTSAHIPGLPAQEAARLRDRLTALGESQAAGL